MNIGIISDSHFGTLSEKSDYYDKILDKLNVLFNDVDHIIHAGDVERDFFIHDLEKFAPVSWVRGNMDFDYPKWPKKLDLEFEGVKIGVAHKLATLAYFKPKPRVFICGHTHFPQIKEIKERVLIINPGSLTKPRYKTHIEKYTTKKPQPSVAFLSLEDGIISALIKKFII